ncbi:class I SAM-dependent methyltransferase [Streptomyces sp. 6N223]|uniref:class I SAM-dependent methyltransferase n=1 Tax=Streptomyces sp. 6N223 TaxID=3457412 RepID=UPI003FD1EA51
MAESFGTDAERYDRARPRYPDALVDRIAAAAGPGRRRVLDVGCGTGIAARQLRAAGCRVLGVEPDARMADLARRLGDEVEVATFEGWDPAGRAFDAVVAATAWHWVDPVAGAAKAARVLRPGGLLAAFWNVPQLPPEVAEAVAEACRRALPDAPFDPRAFQAMSKDAGAGYQPILDKAADGIRAAGAAVTAQPGGGFGEPEQWRYDWEVPYTRDEMLDLLPTQGLFTRLPPDKLAEVREGVGAAVDALGGSFTMRYATVALAAARLAEPGPARAR